MAKIKTWVATSLGLSIAIVALVTLLGADAGGVFGSAFVQHAGARLTASRCRSRWGVSREAPMQFGYTHLRARWPHPSLFQALPLDFPRFCMVGHLWRTGQAPPTWPSLTTPWATPIFQAVMWQRTSSDKPLGMEIAFVTPDVPAAHEQALRHGATELAAPAARPWGQTVSYVRCPDGTLVELCTPILAG